MCKHMELTIEILDINNVDEVFYVYVLQLNKQYSHYLINCQFQLVFNDNRYNTWIKSNLFSSKTLFSWKKYLENVINNFKNKGYNFNHFEELNIITISNEMDMSYDFYIKHNMHAIEWKLNAMINRNKSLINMFPRYWRPPLNRKIESYRV